jgi:hypothetical protein
MTIALKMLDAALAYAQRGWRIVPLKPRSKFPPLMKDWPNQASTDSDVIRSWFRRWPDMNIGIATGRRSGLVVVDVDNYKPEYDGGIERLEERFGKLPETIQALTPAGGEHYLFKYPEGVRIGNKTDLEPAIDIKATGGYIVAPPSVHSSGKSYIWEVEHDPLDGAELADFPLSLASRARPAGKGNGRAAQAVSEADVRTAIECLHKLRPEYADSYDLWVGVGMACHSVDTSDRMFEQWDKWSQQSQKYDPAACREKWESFSQEGNRAGRIGLWHLISWAGPKTHKAEGQPPRPWIPFHTDTLPEPLRSFVKEGSQAIGCDPSFIALPALAMLMSCIGTTRRLKVKGSWAEPAVLWCAVIAESGTLKSPAFDLALEPLWKHQKDAFKEHNDAMDLYEVETAEHAVAYDRWKRKSGGRNKGKPPPEKPEYPEPQRFICSDVTVEALAPILEANPRGVLLGRDELGGWLRSFNAYKRGQGGDVECWLEMHRAGHLLVDRKTGNKKTSYVPRAAVSICGTIQPAPLEVALSQEHFSNGLAARLLLVKPPRWRKRWTDKDLSPGVKTAMGSIVDQFLTLKHNTDDTGDPVPVDIEFTPTGQVAWIQFYNQFPGDQTEVSGDLAAAFSKLEGYAARFALLIHFVRWAARDPTLAYPEQIDERSVGIAVTLAHWFAYETRRIYQTFGESERARERRELVDFLKSRGGEITPRELTQGSRKYQPVAVAHEALQELVNRGLGEWTERESDETGGRPSKRFQLKNGVYETRSEWSGVDGSVYETPNGAVENQGFVDVDSVDTAQPDKSGRKTDKSPAEEAWARDEAVAATCGLAQPSHVLKKLPGIA